MPHTPPTEEQVKHIARRWLLYDWLWFALVSITLLIVFAIIFRNYPGHFAGAGLVAFLFSFVGAGLLSQWAAKRFVRGLSTEEKRLITNATVCSKRHTLSFDKLLKACEINVQQEYLRASQPTESGDTLLRAATSTDETPQEQLL